MQSKFSNYAKTVIALINGDGAEVIALANERKAQSALKGQISALESKEVNDEDSLSDAQEYFRKVFAPATKIGEQTSYILNLKSARDKVVKAQDNLDDTRESLKFYRGLLATEFEVVA